VRPSVTALLHHRTSAGCRRPDKRRRQLLADGSSLIDGQAAWTRIQDVRSAVHLLCQSGTVGLAEAVVMRVGHTTAEADQDEEATPMALEPSYWDGRLERIAPWQRRRWTLWLCFAAGGNDSRMQPGEPATSPCPLGCSRANTDTRGNDQGLRTVLARAHQAASRCPLGARLRNTIALAALRCQQEASWSEQPYGWPGRYDPTAISS
jgi:hypothetical protein